MLGFNRWLMFKILAVALCVVGTTSLLLIYFIPAPPSKITIGTGSKGNIFEFYGHRYQQIFARAHVNLDVRLTIGGPENLQLMDDPDSGVQIGFALREAKDAYWALRATASPIIPTFPK